MTLAAAVSKPHDLIVFGASGFTGRLVAEYLNATCGVGGALNWAMGVTEEAGVLLIH